MKKISLAVLMSFALTGIAFADTHPCEKIKSACEAAGFTKGDHKDGKGLHKDCMKPIMSGQTVAGVTVDAGDLQACQAKKATWKQKHGG